MGQKDDKYHSKQAYFNVPGYYLHYIYIDSRFNANAC